MSSRLRVRRVNECALRAKALDMARSTDKPVILVEHGGGVANAYRWPAETEAVVVVAWPDGRFWESQVERIRANGVTTAGAFKACTGFSILFDGRYGAERRAKARKEFLAWAAEAAERELVS